MKHVTFRFYAELNDFLPVERRHREFVCPFQGRVSVKDLIESLGIPHPEVDLILANGQSVDFTYVVCDADRISVYPMFESFDISPVIRLRPTPLREPRFVLDTHLGRLAAHLRLAGFDALYRNDYQDAELVEISTGQQRILLSRDQALLKCGALTHAYYVREIRHAGQLVEVLRRFDLCRLVKPFQRCLRCN
ncbi:MAG: Mut7-C RNAse domain-containing protein, partial [Acidimicrobiia bacterium]